MADVASGGFFLGLHEKPAGIIRHTKFCQQMPQFVQPIGFGIYCNTQKKQIFVIRKFFRQVPHRTQRLFHSLPLLERKRGEKGRLTLQLFGGECPVVLVSTKKHLREALDHMRPGILLIALMFEAVCKSNEDPSNDHQDRDRQTCLLQLRRIPLCRLKMDCLSGHNGGNLGRQRQIGNGNSHNLSTITTSSARLRLLNSSPRQALSALQEGREA